MPFHKPWLAECKFVYDRANEFEGNISILGLDVYATSLSNLKILNLYDNHLTSLEVRF
jgi:hypothetical protein